MTSEPGRVCRRTAARLAMEEVRKKMAASLLKSLASRSSKRSVSKSSRAALFSHCDSLMVLSICSGARVTTSLRRSIIWI